MMDAPVARCAGKRRPAAWSARSKRGFLHGFLHYMYVRTSPSTKHHQVMAKRKRDRAATTADSDGNSAVPSSVATSLPPPRKPLPAHQLVLAPMVGGSELAYRLLARRHGAQLCYTPMMQSATFLAPKKTERGIGQLEVHPDDSPLVAHFSGNDPSTLLAACKRAERLPGVVAVDLNLGCPQRSAHSGHYGAFLCVEPSDRQLVLKIVETLAKSLTVPVFCKIRLLDDGIDATVSFARQLESAGCALLAVHGRYRGSPLHRRDGPAHLDQIREIKRALAIPVLTNGNVRNAAELIETLAFTGCDGVMTAEAALDDPAIFARARTLRETEHARLTAAVKRAKAARSRQKDVGAGGGGGGELLSPEDRDLISMRKQAKAKLSALPSLPPPLRHE